MPKIECFFHDDNANQTFIVYGKVDGSMFAMGNNTSLETIQLLHPKEEDDYDSKGALMYVVAVILVYSIAMFLLVATLLRKKSSHKNLDCQVECYIKGLREARAQAKVCITKHFVLTM